MTADIPDFAEATRQMRQFLASRGQPNKLLWVFREDLCRRGRFRVLLRQPPYPENEALSLKVYDEGRAKGLVGITAVAKSRDTAVVSVWYPKYEGEEIQGWSDNIKLSISEPLPSVLSIPATAWSLVQRTPWYRRYQDRELWIGTRDWAAA